VYKARRPDAKPRYDTIATVCAALGVRLAAQAVHGRGSHVKGMTRRKADREKVPPQLNADLRPRVSV